MAKRKKKKSKKAVRLPSKFVGNLPGKRLAPVSAKEHSLFNETLFSRRIAAVDIGSNAIRMILAEQSQKNIHVLERFRFPIRLGADVFKNGKISPKTLRASARAFRDFAKLADRFHVRSILAVGTSALREAKNSGAFIKAVRKSSNINVRIIDGVEEARLVHLAVKNQMRLRNQKALLIDVGGGSIELTFSQKGHMSATQSFPYGTVRTLQFMKEHHLKEIDLDFVLEEVLDPMTHFVQTQRRRLHARMAVGTGGNVESLARLKAKLLKSNDREEITLIELEELIARLRDVKVKDRIKKFNLRPDRADVIVPAALLIRAALCRAKIKAIQVPYVGLKEGLLWQVANRAWSLKK